MSNIDKIRKLVANPGDEDDIDVNIQSVMTSGYYDNFDEEIAYIVENHFKRFTAEEIDYEYIKKVWPCFKKHKEFVREQVNEYAVSFWYDSMDLMDRVLFILWYSEFIEMWTPKEVVLNEMVELWKRYGDESSGKLLNGIWHKILTKAQEWRDKEESKKKAKEKKKTKDNKKAEEK